MRHIIFTIVLVAGCATDTEPPQETQAQQELVGRCRATGNIESFTGGWEDFTQQRCCHLYYLGGKTYSHCVQCGGSSGWTCTGY